MEAGLQNMEESDYGFPPTIMPARAGGLQNHSLLLCRI